MVTVNNLVDEAQFPSPNGGLFNLTVFILARKHRKTRKSFRPLMGII